MHKPCDVRIRRIAAAMLLIVAAIFVFGVCGLSTGIFLGTSVLLTAGLGAGAGIIPFVDEKFECKKNCLTA